MYAAKWFFVITHHIIQAQSIQWRWKSKTLEVCGKINKDGVIFKMLHNF